MVHVGTPVPGGAYFTTMTIEPDTKDWTWVLERPCPECGFDARSVRRVEVKNRMYANGSAWRRVLEGEDAGVRPVPSVWSPLEYACHVRDVHLLFAERVRRMLTEDDPAFENWDQDATAIQNRYGDQQPATVADELTDAAAVVSDIYADVTGDQWERPGRRSDGSAFTVDTLARYHLHDIEHHLYDVSG